jgi:hypothetical protein
MFLVIAQNLLWGLIEYMFIKRTAYKFCIIVCSFLKKLAPGRKMAVFNFIVEPTRVYPGAKKCVSIPSRTKS